MTRSRVARVALGGSLALWGVLFTVSARAGLVNDVPSCYVAERMPYKPASPSHLIYVLLDQTVQLDPDLHPAPVDLHNGGVIFSAATIEQREQLPRACAQYARHVRGDLLRQLPGLASGKRAGHVAARQAHARSMPSIATSTT